MHKGRNSKIKSKNEQIKRQRYTKRELRKTPFVWWNTLHTLLHTRSKAPVVSQCRNEPSVSQRISLIVVLSAFLKLFI